MTDKWIDSLPVREPAMDRLAYRPIAGSYIGAPERLPAPIGINCDKHPTFPLVWAAHKGQPDMGWCRRGQHLVQLTNAQKP